MGASVGSVFIMPNIPSFYLVSDRVPGCGEIFKFPGRLACMAFYFESQMSHCRISIPELGSNRSADWSVTVPEIIISPLVIQVAKKMNSPVQIISFVYDRTAKVIFIVIYPMPSLGFS